MRFFGILLLVIALAAGCSTATPATQAPSEPKVGITAQALGPLLDEHDPDAFALTGGKNWVGTTTPTEFVAGISATSWHRATPGHPQRQLSVTYSPAPYPKSGCPKATCTERDGLQVWTEPVRLISVRDEGFVVVTGSADYFSGERRSVAIDVVTDSRIGATVDQALAGAGAANQRWTDNLDACDGAEAKAPIALPAVSGEKEPVTPQALAAVIVSVVGGSCASDEGGWPEVAGTVRLGSEDEGVRLSVGNRPYRCPALDTCRTDNGVTIAKQLDLPEEYPARIVLARPLADGEHWVIVTHFSMEPHHSRPFPVPMNVLTALLDDPRVQPSVDAALNQAGNELPLPWRFTPTTSG